MNHPGLNEAFTLQLDYTVQPTDASEISRVCVYHDSNDKPFFLVLYRNTKAWKRVDAAQVVPALIRLLTDHHPS